MMLDTLFIEVVGDRSVGSQLAARCLDAFGVAPIDTEYGENSTFMMEFVTDKLEATIVCVLDGSSGYWRYGITAEPKNIDPETWALMCSTLSAPLGDNR